MQSIALRESKLAYNPKTPDTAVCGDDVLVRVRLAGICETDLQLVQGYMGFEGILGHEFVGEALTGPFAGKRVVGEINCPCGACDTCAAGLGNHCPRRTVLGILGRDGAFAETLALPQQNLHLVPDNLSDEAAVFTEPVAAAFQIPAQLPIAGGERILILGDGRLGNLCGQVLQSLGAQVLVAGKHPDKLQTLTRIGLETRHIDELAGERVWDIVVDCTGNTSGLPLALSRVRPRGTVVLKTTVAGPHAQSLAPVVIDEVNIVGSRCGPFAPALAALSQGTVQVETLIHDRLPFRAAEHAFELAAQPGVFKVLLDPAL